MFSACQADVYLEWISICFNLHFKFKMFGFVYSLARAEIASILRHRRKVEEVTIKLNAKTQHQTLVVCLFWMLHNNICRKGIQRALTEFPFFPFFIMQVERSTTWIMNSNESESIAVEYWKGKLNLTLEKSETRFLFLLRPIICPKNVTQFY